MTGPRSSWAALLLLGAARVHSFRVLEDGGNFSTSQDFVAYDLGFTHRTYDATRSHRGPRINPGAERLEADRAQACPSMVGPFAGDRYFCTTKDHGYCDRRSGVCHCYAGYQGEDCSECKPSHFSMANNLGGVSCYAKALCPADCSGAGECDYWTGQCACLPHRTGEDCSSPLCSVFHERCDACTEDGCVQCAPAFYRTNSSSEPCRSCLDFDPRCVDCSLQGCLQCADALLSSVRRSGFRRGDSLPLEDAARELSVTLPFGTQHSDAFAESEPYRVYAAGSTELRHAASSCAVGVSRDASYACRPVVVSHRVCGHEGVFAFEYPAYRVGEDSNRLRIKVVRSGGAPVPVRIAYALRHITTDTADVTATALYTSSRTLFFAAGVVEVSFEVTILEDIQPELDEVFQLVLEPPSAGSLGPQSRTNVTIVDNDALAADPLACSFTCLHPRPSATNASDLDYTQSVFTAGAELSVGLRLRTHNDSMTGTMERPSIFAVVSPESSVFDIAMDPLANVRSATVTDNFDGSYQVSAVVTEQGQYYVHAWLAFPGGLTAQAFDNAHSAPTLRRVDRAVNFTWADGAPSPSLVWKGCVAPLSSGEVFFRLSVSDSARLFVDGQLLIDHFADRRADSERPRSIFLLRGKLYAIRVEYRAISPHAYVRLLWGVHPSALDVVPDSCLFALYKLPEKFPVLVTSDLTSPSNTECFGNGLFAGISGTTSSFECCPMDSYNNVRDDALTSTLALDAIHGTAKIVDSPNLVSGAPEEVPVMFMFDPKTRCFQAEYIPFMAGVYSLDIGISDTYGPSGPIAGSPFRVTVATTSTSYSQSLILGLPSSEMEAGTCANHTVVARDKWGNLKLQGGDNFEVQAIRTSFTEGDPAPPFGVLVRGITVDHSTGNYSMSVCLTLAGTYSVHTLLNEDTDVGSSPYQIIVKNAAPFAGNSFAFGAGLAYAVVAVPAYFIVTIRDAFNNIVRNAVNTSALTARLSPTPATLVNFTDMSNGSYFVVYVAKKQGNAALLVKIGNGYIAGSPFSVLIAPGATSASYSFAQGVGLIRGRAGEPSTFSLTSLDLAENRKVSSTDKFIFIATMMLNSTTASSTNITGPLLPCVTGVVVCAGDLNGQYYASFVPTIAGTWRVGLYLSTDQGLIEVSNSPFFPFVRPADAKATNTVATGSIYGTVAGLRSSILLQLFDRFNNLLIVGGDIIAITFTLLQSTWMSEGMIVCCPDTSIGAFKGQGGLIASGVLNDLNNGSYLANYELQIAGEYEMTVRILSPGLNATYYNSTMEDMEPEDTQVIAPDIVAQVLFAATSEKPSPTLHRPEQWKGVFAGVIIPEVAEIYTFTVVCDAGSRVRLYVSESAVNTSNAPLIAIDYTNTARADYQFVSKSPRNILLEYTHFKEDYALQLLWQSSSTQRAIVPPSALFHWNTATSTRLLLTPAVLSSKHSTAYGPGLLSGLAGAVSSFSIQARDMYGNALQVGGSVVQMYAVSKGVIVASSSTTDLGNSTYLVEYIPLKAGLYRVFATIGCCPLPADLGITQILASTSDILIAGSPFSVMVAPARISPLHSYASGVAIENKPVSAGFTSVITVHFFDLYGNPTYYTQDITLSLEVKGLSDGVVYIPDDITVSYTDLSASLSFVITKAGRYSIAILVSRISRLGITMELISGATYVIESVSNAPYANSTSSRGISLRSCTANRTMSFELALFDEYGNPTEQEYFFSTTVMGISADPPTCKWLSSNIHSCSYIVPSNGEYKIGVSLLSRRGLLGQYYSGYFDQQMRGSNALRSEVDASVGIDWPGLLDVASAIDTISVVWSGFIVPPQSGQYFFHLSGSVADGSIFVDGKLGFNSATNISAPYSLAGMTGYSIRVVVLGLNVKARPAVQLQWRREPSLKVTWIPISWSYLYVDATSINHSPFTVVCST